jgi:DNA helicase-2/ATP-dependent DNA helicase PcrA
MKWMTGKTHVLSKRVAYLVQHYKVEASNIVVLTFTNKASIEMKSRIKELISTKQVEKLKMGTFHSICRSYLQKYFKLIALPSNFIIADRDDCIAIIRRALNSTTIPDSLRKECDPKTMLDMISKAKSQNLSWHQWRIQAEQSHDDRFREKMLLMSTIFE